MTPGRFTRLHAGRRLWSALGDWLGEHTYPASWLPQRLRHPAIGYLAAFLFELLAIGLILLLALVFSPDVFQGALLALVSLLLALHWGAGPGLLATFLGTLLLVMVALPPQFSWELDDPSDLMDLGLTNATGVTASVVASRMGHARRQAESLAREAAQAKAQMEAFLGIASHELNTPLTVLKLQLQLTSRHLQRQAPAETAAAVGQAEQVVPVNESLTRMKQNVGRLERLVHDLLEMSRIQAGEVALRLESLDLAGVVRLVVEEQQALSSRTIGLHLSTGLPVSVVADPDRIAQVLTNYLTNALKYSPAEQPVEVGLEMQEHQARVWVRDAGPGISQGEQVHIWERFYRVPGMEVQSGSGIGLGLGLSICREIVERHQGQVGVESTPGRGSTFWFTLPVASAT